MIQEENTSASRRLSESLVRDLRRELLHPQVEEVEAMITRYSENPDSASEWALCNLRCGITTPISSPDAAVRPLSCRP
jgi:hypothetical protein